MDTATTSNGFVTQNGRAVKTRSLGEGLRTARDAGADTWRQLLYGAGKALSVTQIERLFDGLNGLYGEGKLDKAITDFVENHIDSITLRRLVKAALNDAGEGTVESVLTDIANQMLKTIYNNQDPIQNAYETKKKDILRNMLINAPFGILAGDSGIGKR